MKSYQDRKAQKLYESVKATAIQTERHGERLGNELKDTQTGGTILKSPFKEKTENFKKKLTGFPETQSGEKKALGDLGMSQIGKTTFKSTDKLKAGRTPTLSKGMPVQEAMMSGSEMKQSAESEIARLSQEGTPLTQRFIAYAQNKPVAQLIQTQQEMQKLLPYLIQQSSPTQAKTAIRGAATTGMQMNRGYGKESPMSQQPQVGQAGTAIQAACKKV